MSGPPSGGATGAAAVRLGVLLTAAMALSTIMQFTIGALGPTLTDDLRISRSQLGTLSAVYYLAAAVLSRPMGRWIDRVEPTRALQGVFIASGVALAAAAAAPTYALLLAAVLPAGAAAAASNPVTNRVIAHLPGRRGTLLGIKQSGVQLGALLAGALLPGLTAGIGWRPALLCVAALCGVAITTTSWAPHNHVHARPCGADGLETATGGARWLALYAFFMGAGMSTVTTYLPLYAEDRLEVARTAAGALLAVVGLGGILARVWWTRLHERRSPGSFPLLVGLAAAALTATGLLVAAPATGPWLLWVCAGLLGLSAAAWNAVAMLVVLERTPAAWAGRASGYVLTAFFLGLAASAPAFGALVDAADDYRAGWALTAAAFAAAAWVAGRAPGRAPIRRGCARSRA